MDLDLFKVNRIVYISVFALVSAISCAFVFIAVYFTHFFYKADFPRILAIAIGVTTPIILLNCITVSRSNSKIESEVGAGSFFLIFGLGASSLVGYMGHVGPNVGILITLVLNFLPIAIYNVNRKKIDAVEADKV